MDLDENALVFAANACGAAIAVLCPPLALVGAMAGPAADYILKARAEKTARLVVEAFEKRGSPPLDEEHKAELVPMVYRIIEATRQGEYEHTIKVLAAFIAGETGQEISDAGNFARMAKRLEGVSMDELKLIAHLSDMLGPTSGWLNNASYNLNQILDRVLGADYWPTNLAAARPFREALHELGARGFLLTNEMSLIGGDQTGFQPTENLRELLDKAGIAIKGGNP